MTITEERAKAYKTYLTGADYQLCSDDMKYSLAYVRAVATRIRYNEDIVNDLNSRLRRAYLAKEKDMRKDKKLIKNIYIE